MGVVAICTGHFAFFKRVVRDFFAIGTLLFVAGVANLGLGFFAQNLVGRTVHLVAIVASHAAVLVLATVPIVAFGVFVAGQALAGTFFVFGDFERAFLEDHIRSCTALGVGVTLDVLVTLAVARLAAGGTGIATHTVSQGRLVYADGDLRAVRDDVVRAGVDTAPLLADARERLGVPPDLLRDAS